MSYSRRSRRRRHMLVARLLPRPARFRGGDLGGGNDVCDGPLDLCYPFFIFFYLPFSLPFFFLSSDKAWPMEVPGFGYYVCRTVLSSICKKIEKRDVVVFCDAFLCSSLCSSSPLAHGFFSAEPSRLVQRRPQGGVHLVRICCTYL